MIVRIARVKVGNRQAPQQQAQTPPHQGGVSAFTRPESGRMGNGLTKKSAIRRALGATEPDIRKSRKRTTSIFGPIVCGINSAAVASQTLQRSTTPRYVRNHRPTHVTRRYNQIRIYIQRRLRDEPRSSDRPS